MPPQILQKVRQQIQKKALDKIASGSIGTVYRVRLRDGSHYIVKKRHAVSAAEIEEFNRQARMNRFIQRTLGNNHIVPKYYGKTTIHGEPYLVFEEIS